MLFSFGPNLSEKQEGKREGHLIADGKHSEKNNNSRRFRLLGENSLESFSVGTKCVPRSPQFITSAQSRD